MNGFELLALPLSAYTPGLGDPSMEGGYETASGEPVYTYEQWLAGKAPYVTGATSVKNPSGALTYRTVGDQQVPVRITDYGPGVKGIDIASSNEKWGKNFPYQGAVDKFMPPGSPTVAAGVSPAFQPADGAVPAPAGINDLVPGPSFNYDKFNNTASAQDVGGALASSLGSIGKGMQQSSQQGMQQALAMLHSDPRAQQALAQLAANPWMFLQPLRLG